MIAQGDLLKWWTTPPSLLNGQN